MIIWLIFANMRQKNFILDYKKKYFSIINITLAMLLNSLMEINFEEEVLK
jgi:hypothetical protein